MSAEIYRGHSWAKDIKFIIEANNASMKLRYFSRVRKDATWDFQPYKLDFIKMLPSTRNIIINTKLQIYIYFLCTNVNTSGF